MTSTTKTVIAAKAPVDRCAALALRPGAGGEFVKFDDLVEVELVPPPVIKDSVPALVNVDVKPNSVIGKAAILLIRLVGSILLKYETHGE